MALEVVQQPVSCLAGQPISPVPSVALVDAHNNQVLAVPGNQVLIHANLVSSNVDNATLYRVGCGAACTTGAFPVECSDELRASGPHSICTNVAVASAGVSAVFKDLTVNLAGEYHISFETASPIKG